MRKQSSWNWIRKENQLLLKRVFLNVYETLSVIHMAITLKVCPSVCLFVLSMSLTSSE